jgi:hypothetical protein
VLIYNATTSLWEKNTLTAGSGITVTNGAGSITIASSGGGGTGDVVGPASSTDNAVARFDGTTGKLVQNSSFVVNDSGEVTTGVWKGTEVTVPYGGTGVSTLTGIVKGNGQSAFSAATAGTDYLAPPSGTAILKANSGGALANATAGTDYLAPPSGTAILKANSGGALANATAGTDYVAPGTATTFTADQTFNSTRLKLAGSTSGTATLNAPAAAATNTYTLPPDASTLGYLNIPQSGSAKTTSYTLTTADIGEFINVGSGGSVTIPDATFATGDVVSVFNNTTGSVTITCTITTAYIAGTDSDKASVTLATRGVATILFISSTVCVISGNVT